MPAIATTFLEAADAFKYFSCSIICSGVSMALKLSGFELKKSKEGSGSPCIVDDVEPYKDKN